MSRLEIRSLRKSFEGVDVIKGIDLVVEDREFCVFLGPSGCGKSTTLRLIAGLEEADDGQILLDKDDITDRAVDKRDLAMVFQSYALYPHMTVRENMSFALKLSGAKPLTIDEKVAKAAKILALEPYLDRKPSALSGGQRQRVAIGRAITREPRVFLFDEPLSNLDAALRAQTRLEIARLHQELNATMIYVTHDQVEAMTLADKIVVLNAGRIEQIGSPMELYNSPANEFVAGFIGSPKMNFIDGARLGETAKTIGVRPEHLTVDTKSGAWKGTVVHAEHLGADTNLYLDCEKAGLITVRIFGVYNAEPGATLYATPDAAKTYRFGADGKVLR